MNYLKILKLMDKNLKINRGLPIVACVFDENFEVITIESNNPNSQEYKNHAEILCLNNLEKQNIKDFSNLILFINTTPCDICSQKIISYDTNFHKIYYLVDKFHSDKDNLWKTIEPKLKKYTGGNLNESSIIKKINSTWNNANIQNRQKTIKNKKLREKK